MDLPGRIASGCIGITRTQKLKKEVLFSLSFLIVSVLGLLFEKGGGEIELTPTRVGVRTSW